MLGRAEDLSVFAIPGGRRRGKQRALSAKIKLWCKNSQSDAERAFELPYFSLRQAVTKIIVQGANTDQ